MHPLEGPRLKIRRAESQIKSLDDVMFAMWKDTPFHIVRAERNPRGILKKCVNGQAVYPLSEQDGLKAQERRYTAYGKEKH